MEVEVETEHSYFDALPWDVVVRIFSFLPPQEVSRVSCVCRLFRDVVHSSDLWSEYVGSREHSYVSSTPLLRHLESPATARELYDEIQGLRGTAHELIHSGVSCSSKDSDEQDIGATLKSDIFWSSTGSATPDADEWLVYRLREPISVVLSVVIEPYRALYQTGTPMYAPRGVSFSFGFSEGDWHYTTPVYPVDAHEPCQRFDLAPQLCVGEYVRLNLIGKRETQPADDLYYTVIDTVHITGVLFGALPPGGPLAGALLGFGMSHAGLAGKGKSSSTTTAASELVEAMTKDADKYLAKVRELEENRNTYRSLVKHERRRELIVFLNRQRASSEQRGKESLRMLYGIRSLKPAKTRMCSVLSADPQRVPLIWECLCVNALGGGFLNAAESVPFFILSKLYGNRGMEETFVALYASILRPSVELAELFFRYGMFDFAVDAYSQVSHFGKVIEVLLHMKKYRVLADFSVRSLFKPDWDAVIEHAARVGSENERLKLAYSLIFPGAAIHPPPGAVVPPGVVLDELDSEEGGGEIIILNGEINKFKVVGLPMAPVDVLSRLHIEMPLLNLLGDLQRRIFDTMGCPDEHPVEVPPPMTQEELQKELDDYFESN